MHGGAFGTGAPPGNKNALRSGLYTAREIKKARKLRELYKQAWQELRGLMRIVNGR